MIVTVVCPECRRAFCVSGRGRCRCGAYLVDHIGRGKGFAVHPTAGRTPDRTWVLVDGRWVRFSDLVPEALTSGWTGSGAALHLMTNRGAPA